MIQWWNHEVFTHCNLWKNIMSTRHVSLIRVFALWCRMKRRLLVRRLLMWVCKGPVRRAARIVKRNLWRKIRRSMSSDISSLQRQIWPWQLANLLRRNFCRKKSELSDSSNTCLRFSSATLRYQQDSMVTVRSPALLCWHVTHLTVVVLLLVDFYVLTL